MRTFCFRFRYTLATRKRSIGWERISGLGSHAYLTGPAILSLSYFFFSNCFNRMRMVLFRLLGILAFFVMVLMISSMPLIWRRANLRMMTQRGEYAAGYAIRVDDVKDFNANFALPLSSDTPSAVLRSSLLRFFTESENAEKIASPSMS